jgi:hypothetical protein
MSVSVGTLVPAFDPDIDEYTVNVSYSTTKFKITAAATVPSTTIASADTQEKTLAIGPNLFKVTLTAGDGSIKEYKINVVKASLTSNDATLKSLEIIIGTNKVTFNSPVPEIYEYEVNNITESLRINAIANSPNADVSGSGTKLLDVGLNILDVIVTAEDGTTIKVYKIRVTRLANDDATLKDIEVTPGDLDPVFDPDITEYKVEVENNVYYINVKGIPNDADATVAGNVTGKSLNLGDNVVTLTVTAADGKTKKTYTVTVVRMSDDATLKSLTILPESLVLSPSFKPEQTTYWVNTPSTITKISVKGIANHPNATVSGNVTDSTLVDNVINPIIITVTSQDGKHQLLYTVNFRHEIPGNGNSYLKSLTLSPSNPPELVPAFDSLKTEYTVRVPHSTLSMKVSAIASDPDATVTDAETVKTLNPGDNKIQIIVVSTNGLKRAYNVNIIRASANASADATLKSLTLNPGRLSPLFDPKVTNYKVNLNHTVSLISDLTGIANHVNASVEGNISDSTLTQITVDDTIYTTFKIKVTAEDMATTKTYTVTIRRAKPASNDITLKSLGVSSGIANFDPYTLHYYDTVASHIEMVDITGVPNHPEALVIGNVIGKKLDFGDNLLPIIVVAEDGSESNPPYTVTIYRKSNDATLKSLTVGSGTLTPEFDPDSTEYTVKVGTEVGTIDVNGIANHPNATVEGNVADKILTIGSNNFVTIKVIAEDTDIFKIYTVRIIRVSNDATLKSLTVSSGELDPVFDPNTLEYKVTVPESIDKISVTGVPNYPEAKVANISDHPLEINVHDTIKLVVTAEDGKTIKIYKVIVTRLSADATLKKLSTSFGVLSPVFNRNILNYTVNVKNTINNVDVSAETNHLGAKIISGTGNYPLPTEGSSETAQITVRSEDDSVTLVYTIKINRASDNASDDATLQSIILSDADALLSPAFSPDETEYKVNIRNSVTAINVFATANHSGATVSNNITGKTLVIGDNLVEIIVVAEDGFTTKTYRVNLVRAGDPANDNAFLSNLTVKPTTGKFGPAFVSSTLAYADTVISSVTSVNIEYTKVDPKATVTITGTVHKNLQVGSNIIPVVVVAENGIDNKIYNVTIVRLSGDATLSSLTVSSGTLNPTFNPDLIEYTVTLQNVVTTIDVKAQANHPKATVADTVSGKQLVVGENIVKITVTAEDKTVSKVYTVKIIRQSADANLRSLTTSLGVLSPAFNSDSTSYRVNVANATDNIDVSATANHSGATIVGTGNYSLNVGNKTVSITVTSEDGSVDKTYTVTIHRADDPASDDATLKDIVLSSGLLSPAFNPNITNYKANIAYIFNGDTIINVAGFATHSKATVTGNVSGKPLAVGENKVYITVVAEDGKTTKTYTINLVRARVNAKTDATLSNLEVIPATGKFSPVFNPAWLNYTDTVIYTVTSVEIKATPNHLDSATVTVSRICENLEVGVNIIPVTVVAEDGINYKIYDVTIVRLSGDATLGSLTVTPGTLAPDFVPANTEYTVTLPYNITSVTVTGTPNHSKATVSGNAPYPLVVGDNIITITVTAEDKTISKPYYITVRRQSNDATLDTITVSSGTLDPVFDPDTKKYTVKVKNSVTSINVIGIANYPDAIVEGNAVNKQLTIVGANLTDTIKVTSEDGSVINYYTVTVIRLSDDATLNNITVSTGTLDPPFDPAVTEYTVILPNIVTHIDVTGTATHAGATVSGNRNNLELTVDADSIVKIEVISEDTTQTKVYTVTVRRQSADATLKDITLTSGTLDPVFDPNTKNYTVKVKNNIESVGITGTANHSGAIVTNPLVRTLIVGVNPVDTVKVTSEDGSITNYYKVTIIRQSADATLDTIIVSSGKIVPAFDPAITEYTVTLSHTVTHIDVNGTAAHAGATVSGNRSNLELTEDSDSIVKIVVTSEDGETLKPYTVTVRCQSGDATLKNITVSSGQETFDPAFDPNTNFYTVRLIHNVSSIDVTGTVNNPKAKIKGNVAGLLINITDTVDIEVTSEDSTSIDNLYRVVIIRSKGDAALKSLTVSSGTLAPVFDPAIPEYVDTVANSVENITITGKPNDDDATVANITDSSLTTGNNIIDIVVTAQDTTIKQIYKVNVYRISADATLKNLTVSSGKLDFDPGITEYTVYTSSSVISVDVNATANHPLALVADTITGMHLNPGLNVVKITVTAENKTTKVYTVNIIRSNNDATLKTLTVSSGALSPAFSPAITDYTVYVENSVVSIDATGTPTDPNASVVNVAGKLLEAGRNVAHVVVTAEDTTITKTYTVTVIRTSSDARLKSLTVSAGQLSPAFHSDTLMYTVIVPYNYASTGVSAEPLHSGATVSGEIADKQLSVGNNAVDITVTAEDGITKRTYTVIIVRTTSPDVSLSSLTVSEGNLDPQFNANTTIYTVNVAHSVKTIDVVGTANHPAATVSGNVTGRPLLVGENNVVLITVTAADKVTTKTYTVIVRRATASDATLKSLTPNKGKLSPAFDPAVNNYSLKVSHSVMTIDIIGVANQENATILDNVRDTPLVSGDNLFTITVIAEDGMTTNKYNVLVVRDLSRSGSDADLISVTANGKGLAVSGTNISYMASCDESTLELFLGTSPYADVKINGEDFDGQLILLEEDITIVNIRVEAETGNAVNNYVLTVAKAYDDHNLYYQRWSDVIAINTNPATNGGYNVEDFRWYKKNSNKVISTENYIRTQGSVSDYYAEVKVDGEWHSICGVPSLATRSIAKIVAYPNPVVRGESLKLQLPDEFIGGYLNIYSLTGLLVKSNIPLPVSLNDINVSELPTGMYLFNLTGTGGAQETVKIIIE